MPGFIFEVRELKQRLEQGAQLVDVLAADDYELDHLPGAISIPLRELNRETTVHLEKDRPVIAYCYDFG